MDLTDPATIEAVWQKGAVLSNPNVDGRTWRKDVCSAWILRSEYGNRNSDYGWEIDHIVTKDDGGSDDLSNLRPLQWENNNLRGTPFACTIKSGNQKIVKVTPGGTVSTFVGDTWLSRLV